MNFFTSQYQGELNFQTRTVLVVRFLRAGDGEAITGKVMLVDGEVKRNGGGKTVLERVCKDEGERVDILESVFGISLTEEERVGIKGRGVELRGT